MSVKVVLAYKLKSCGNKFFTCIRGSYNKVAGKIIATPFSAFAFMATNFQDKAKKNVMDLYTIKNISWNESHLCFF